MKKCIVLILFWMGGTAAYGQMAVSRGVSTTDTSATFSKKLPVYIYNAQRYAPKVVREIPKDMYTRNFGFFCRQELQMHKAHIPISVRVGSFDDCNYLEQKGRGVR